MLNDPNNFHVNLFEKMTIPTALETFRTDLIKKAVARLKFSSAEEVAFLLAAGLIVMETLV